MTPDDVLYRVRVHTLALAEEKRSIALESASHESRTARDDRKAGIVITSSGDCDYFDTLSATGGYGKRRREPGAFDLYGYECTCGVSGVSRFIASRSRA